MRESDYAEAIGNLRMMEKKLLGREQMQRLIDAPSAADALKTLGQSGEYDPSSHNTADYERVLQQSLLAAYERLYLISPETRMLDILRIRYDYNNIKAVVKEKLSGNAPTLSDAGLVNADRLRRAILQAEYPEKTPETPDGLPGFVKATAEAAEDAYHHAPKPQQIDIAADHALFAHMLLLCEELGNGYITGYVRMVIDFLNLKMLMRVKNMKKGAGYLAKVLVDGGQTDKTLFVTYYDKTIDAIAAKFFYQYFGGMMRKAVDSYEKAQNFSELERLCDNDLLGYVRKARFIAFGPEPIFAYMLAKENEIRQIRIIMTSKINNISAELLQERLRDQYA